MLGDLGDKIRVRHFNINLTNEGTLTKVNKNVLEYEYKRNSN
jgi:hypothetical protein